ncbi:MAG: heavy metal translocating P-type ATPase, partial [Candidatus Moranbacteria bacterium]|nr:heavy metal translocating P-type ATPase [Candidatus Moranbacteria bacterium]
KIDNLKKGDVILIKPYEKIPSDGKIVSGKSSVNESMLTGESKPVEKTKGQKVIAGSINQDGSLEVEVKGVGKNSYLNKVIELVKQAQESKSKTQTLADKAAFWLTIIAVTTGVLTFGLWFYFSDNLAFAVERMATVLVITCPHALGLAIPLVAAVSTSLSAKNGLIIKKRQAFENSRKISTVIFDKTGTLTQGSFSLNKIVVLDRDYNKRQIMAWAAALEKKSEHSIAKAIVKKAKKISAPSLEAKNFKVLKGKGVQGKVKGNEIMLISLRHLEKLGLKRPSQSDDLEGTVVVMVRQKNNKKQIIALLGLADSLRKNSLKAVKKLKQKGIKVWMITGDDEKIAKKIADKLELDGYLSELLPHQKQEKIKEFQQKGEFVAMAGDGINDAPALAGADVGIAIGSGTDIASQSADILLVNDDPKDIVKLISFGKKTYRKMVQNLFWAAGYNIFAVPLAAGVLAPFGFILSPAAGAVLMSLSTVVVAFNAKSLNFGV